jgi:hypothetical protein
MSRLWSAFWAGGNAMEGLQFPDVVALEVSCTGTCRTDDAWRERFAEARKLGGNVLDNRLQNNHGFGSTF